MTQDNPSTIRTQQIVVRVNQFELKMLETFAKSQHVTNSEAVRMLIRQLGAAGFNQPFGFHPPAKARGLSSSRFF